MHHIRQGFRYRIYDKILSEVRGQHQENKFFAIQLRKNHFLMYEVRSRYAYEVRREEVILWDSRPHWKPIVDHQISITSLKLIDYSEISPEDIFSKLADHIRALGRGGTPKLSTKLKDRGYYWVSSIWLAHKQKNKFFQSPVWFIYEPSYSNQINEIAIDGTIFPWRVKVNNSGEPEISEITEGDYAEFPTTLGLGCEDSSSWSLRHTRSPFLRLSELRELSRLMREINVTCSTTS